MTLINSNSPTKFLLFVVAFTFLMTAKSIAGISIYLQPLDIQNPSITVSAAKVPLMKVSLRITVDGNVTAIEAKHLLIRENGSAAKPVSVSQPDGNGLQTVTWFTRLRGVIPSADFIVTIGGETVIKRGYSNMTRLPQLRYTMVNEEGYVSEYAFDYTVPNSEALKRVSLIGVANILDKEGNEMMLAIDSLTLNHDNISYVWRGLPDNHTEPPIMAHPAFAYDAILVYRPKANEYYRSTMTTHYAGGLEEKLILSGNSFPIIGDKKNLEIVYPNGNVHLTPCQLVNIQWTGVAPDMPTVLSYSVNNGVSWQKIVTINDSSYVWRVPNQVSDQVKLRVTQEFNDSRVRYLENDGTTVQKISYRSDGAKLLAADVKGRIIEWDMGSRTYEIEYLADPENSGKTAIIPSGVDYTSATDSFAVAYHYPLNYPRQDEIAIFEIGTVEPVKKVSVEAGFETDEMMIDRSRNYIALVPVLGPRVLIHSARDGEFIKDLEFPYPVSSFAFNRARDEAVAALTDGSIYIFDLPNFDIRKIMNFSDIPIITKINIAPSGKLLAIGCDSPQKTTLSGNKNEIHVVDIEKNIIVRSARKTASDPLALEFGPTSAALLVGATSQPQLSLWNLEVPPQGEFFHGLSQLGGSLNDIAFSPAGNAIASAGDRNGELATSNFTYAETDENDTLFSIELPVLDYSVSSVPSQYLGHHESLTYTTAVCNIGDVPLYIDDAFFKTGTHFSAEYITIPDTLWPGECIDLVIDYRPMIVGDIADTLIFEACSNDIEMPVSSKGLARNIDFFTTKLEMGEVCVGAETTKSFRFLINKDPVPLHINQIKADENGVAQFKVIQPLSDTLLMPGQELTITVTFMPRESGHIDRVMEIFHSGVPEYKRSVDIHGFGLGTIYDLSHFDLRFIPEVTEREIEVINDSKNVIYIEEIIFDEPGLLTVLTPLPLEIPAFGSETIRIRTNQIIDSESKMEIIAGPCSISYDVTFGPYSGTSHIVIPEVNADPRGNAVIPLNYTNTDTEPYDGVRPFRAEFTMNPRLFLPQTVVSDYGTGELIRNEIINDKRIIGIEVWGDFPYEGVLAEVKGVAGLAETDRSPIDFIDESKFWGVNVETTYESGMFILINVDDGRRIIQDNNLVLKTISPNPVSDEFLIEFESLESGEATVIVYDNLGNQLLSSGLIRAHAGTNTLTMSAAAISSGTYRVVVRRGVFSATKTIVIIR